MRYYQLINFAFFCFSTLFSFCSLRAFGFTRSSDPAFFNALVCEKILTNYLSIEDPESEQEILEKCSEKIELFIDPLTIDLYRTKKNLFTFSLNLTEKSLFLEGNGDINEYLYVNNLLASSFAYVFDRFKVVNFKIKSRKRNDEPTIRDRLVNVVKSALKNEYYAPSRAEVRWYDKNQLAEQKIHRELGNELPDYLPFKSGGNFCLYDNSHDAEVVVSWLALVDEEQEILPSINNWQRKKLIAAMYARGFSDGTGSECYQFYFKIYFNDGWMINVLYDLRNKA